MVRAIQEVEPTCFEQAVGNPMWDNAMDEEMAGLDVDVTWELVVYHRTRKQLGANGCTKLNTMQMDL